MMALIQNASNVSLPEADDGVVEYSLIPNGNRVSPPELDDSVVKVVVIGEPKCGKTKFIRAYYDHHFPDDRYSHNGVRVYPCEFVKDNEIRRTSIFEIPSDPDFFPEQRIAHYEEADVFVFVYAIDDPSSLEMLTQKWMLEVSDTIGLEIIPVVFVGTKLDLRKDQQVVQRLALDNKSPVTHQQGYEMLDKVASYAANVECSANNLQQVEFAFSTIFSLAD